MREGGSEGGSEGGGSEGGSEGKDRSREVDGGKRIEWVRMR